MGLPARTFYHIFEASVRWGCTPADIAGWASAGMLDLVTSVTRIVCDGQEIAGLAAIQQTLGQDKAALATWYKALEVYPAMKSAQKSVIELEEELAGRSL